MGVVVSPELALIDDELRALARAGLPPVEPYAFLEPEREQRVSVPPAPSAVATVRRTWRRRLAAAAPWLLVALLGTLVGLLIGYWLEQLLPAPPEGMPLPLQSLYLLQRL